MSTWDILREIDSMRREFDRVFRDAGLGEFLMPARRAGLLPVREVTAYPLVDVSEDAGAVYVDALAPGLDPGSISVNVVRNQLTISGEKADTLTDVDADAVHRSERAGARFTRTLTLPTEINADRAEARCHQGILRITLPKAESARPKQITVNVA